MSKVVRFVTLGCKVNQYETNAMAQKFLEKGYQIIEEITPENEDIKPDTCIYNTYIRLDEIGRASCRERV